jgi:hypothetical protein
MFSKSKCNQGLSPHRYVDHEITLQPNAKPPFGPLYSMSPKKLQVLKDYLEENLIRGFVKASTSSASCSVLFALKPSGGFPVCVDDLGINDLTMKTRCPLPRRNETIQGVQGSTMITRLNLRMYYNQIGMRKGNEGTPSSAHDMGYL